MGSDGDVTVVLPRQLAEEIRASVESGDYASDREAVEDAVRLWSAARRGSEPDLAIFRRAWADGKASGLHGRMDFDALRDEARQRSEDGSMAG